MSRKQFDRMELLTDETEVDRTFLHSKLHAIVHVPFSLCFSRSRSSVSIISSSPFALRCSTGSNHQIRPGAGCKYLLLQKSWHTGSRGSSRIRRKARAECTPPLFQAQITTDLSWFNPGSPYLGHVISFFDQRFNGIPFYFAFFLPSLLFFVKFDEQKNGSRAITIRSKRINNRCSGNSSNVIIRRNYVGFIFLKKEKLMRTKELILTRDTNW